jgi:hypothetical protein
MTFRGGMGMGRNGRRLRVEPTDEWEQIELLCGWPEQRDYELIRPLVLFGAPADGRAGETAAGPIGGAVPIRGGPLGDVVLEAGREQQVRAQPQQLRHAL